MTNKESVSEALYELKYAIEDWEIDSECPTVSIDTMEVSIDALEKQIPKKPMEQISVMPIYSDNGCSSDVVVLYKAMCPNCNEELAYGELERSDCADIKFCSHCSQAIDWSEE